MISARAMTSYSVKNSRTIWCVTGSVLRKWEQKTEWGVKPVPKTVIGQI
jgi:hypothetical protein